MGRTLDEVYRIDAPIGEGAMGRVYRAERVATGERVAIKLLHDHLSGDPRIAKRFYREARAASLLSHPNSLVIVDFGEARDGTLFIAMELLEGEDLQTIVDHEAPLTPRRIGALMGQTLDALSAAHQAGIIHRDLKPENVVVLKEEDGAERVKVCDFGIAKIVETEGRTTAITKDGYVCGTPEYMAPEQAKGEPIDVRADVYAAGVMLYQLLCGRVPFKAETALGLITKHIMDVPLSPREVQPSWGIPRSLAGVALRALEKQPADRFPDAAALREAIDAAVEALGDRAAQRLGEGFADDEAEDEDEQATAAGARTVEAPAVRDARHGTPGEEPPAAAEAPTTQEAIERALPASRAPIYAAWASAALVLLGVAAWAAWGTEPAESNTVPVREAPPREPPDPAPAPTGSPPAPAVASPTPPVASTDEEVPRARPPRPPAVPARDPGRAAFDEGRALLLRGDLSGAVERLGEAARLRPRDAAVHRELGRALVRSGDVPSGVRSYRRYLELAPAAPDRAVIERIIAQHGP